jgi:hypothetical protein
MVNLDHRDRAVVGDRDVLEQPRAGVGAVVWSASHLFYEDHPLGFEADHLSPDRIDGLLICQLAWADCVLSACRLHGVSASFSA